MNRISFPEGKQKEFLENVRQNLNAPSMTSILQYGFTTTATALKNYYTERRNLPEELFEEMCQLAKIEKSTLEYQEKKINWGQQKGGSISKRKGK
ncbi:MAG: hypothetical protein ACI83O_000512 [Patescibacteria group bacterium]|jgi:hypothetical protein